MMNVSDLDCSSHSAPTPVSRWDDNEFDDHAKLTISEDAAPFTPRRLDSPTPSKSKKDVAQILTRLDLSSPQSLDCSKSRKSDTSPGLPVRNQSPSTQLKRALMWSPDCVSGQSVESGTTSPLFQPPLQESEDSLDILDIEACDDDFDITGTDIKYGYEEAAPSASATLSATAIRSSMKGSNPRRPTRQPVGDLIKLRLPGKKEKVKKQRFIQISDDVETFEIIPMESNADKTDLWFQQDELFERRLKIRDILRKAEEAGDEMMSMEENNDSFCLRGIEGQMKDEAQRRDEISRDLYEHILATQSVQRGAGFHDSFQLATFSERISEESRQKAVERAAADALAVAMEAREDYQKVRRTTRRMSSVI